MATNWDDISFVISSQYRTAVLHQLADGPATPTQISQAADHDLAHISRALRNLRDRNAVTLLVSEDKRKGRVYGITDHGQNVWQHIQTEGMVDLS